MDIGIIYPFRNPFDRLYSTIKQNVVTNSLYEWKGKSHPDYIKGRFKVDFDILIKSLYWITDSVNLEWAYKITDDVFLTKFDDIINDLNPVFKYLNVDPIDIKMEKTNEMKWWSCDPFKNIKAEVDLFWKDNIKEIAKIVLDDLTKTQKIINVEDWIIEAENILSNV